MKDLRTRGGVPFGYSIQNGDAVINNEEAEKLLDYFDYFLAGLSMAAAAREAGLACDPATLPHLFFRKEYTGSDLYPSLMPIRGQMRMKHLFGFKIAALNFRKLSIYLNSLDEYALQATMQ